MAAAYAKFHEITDEHTKNYFTTEEWDAMPDMEKIRKTSLLRNYLVLKEFAFDPEPPDFVRRQQIRENPELANKKFVPSIPKILSGPYTINVSQKDELLMWNEDDFNKAVAFVVDHIYSGLDHPKVEGQNKE